MKTGSQANESAPSRGGATFVDTTSWLCPSEPCPMVIGRYLVYRDTNHLAMPFAWALASRLDDALER